MKRRAFNLFRQISLITIKIKNVKTLNNNNTKMTGNVLSLSISQTNEIVNSEELYPFSDVMGQSLSSDLDSVDNLSEELFRQARNLSEVASLSYEEFQQYLKELNELSQKCMDAEGKQLMFAVKEGSDSTVLWKGIIRIACVKIDPITKEVETYRLLNLNQFLKVYKSMSSQCAAAQESQASNPSTSKDIKQLTTSVVLRHMVEQTDAATECCICLERQPDMLLPCAHAYCRPCIEQWSVSHKTCPICREEANNDEAWVLSEAPNSLEVSEEICSSLMELVDRQPSTDTDDSL